MLKLYAFLLSFFKIMGNILVKKVIQAKVGKMVYQVYDIKIIEDSK
jgi:hypothetical protein